MEIRKYAGKYTEASKLLYKAGALLRLPVQIKRDDLIYDEGVDVRLYFKGMTPAKFREYADLILEAAYQEASRYEDEKLRFAKLEVELGRTTKGRKTLGPERTYTASMHPDSEIMVYGEKALGYGLPEEAGKKPFLINKVEEVLSIPGGYAKDELKKQRPYKVLLLVICIRAGLKKVLEEFRKGLKEEKGE